jgi:hypothetical protein
MKLQTKIIIGASVLGVVALAVILLKKKKKTSAMILGDIPAGDVSPTSTPTAKDDISKCMEAELLTGMTIKQMRQKIAMGDVSWISKLSAAGKEVIANCKEIEGTPKVAKQVK